MDSISAAVSLARGLLALAESQQTGVLHVRSELGTGRLLFERGVLHAVSDLPGADDTLGDRLLQEGDLDPSAHRDAWLESFATSGPIGDWLLERGLCSKAAIDLALRAQLCDRVRRVFECQRIDYRFEVAAEDRTASSSKSPMTTDRVVLFAMRQRIAGWSREQAASVITGGKLRLNALGWRLTREIELEQDEASAIALLMRGATLAAVMRDHESLRVWRLLATLALLSALTSQPLRERRFSLLLRKREELRRAAGAAALLDLPSGATPGEARRALRKLARRLHPDVLGSDAEEALRVACGEVMGALIAAERELRVDGTTPH